MVSTDDEEIAAVAAARGGFGDRRFEDRQPFPDIAQRDVVQGEGATDAIGDGAGVRAADHHQLRAAFATQQAA